MVAFNYQPQFADDVEDGIKTMTIRKKARCKPGDRLQHYTGMMHKYCRKLMDATCTAVKPIHIDHMGIILDGQRLHAGWSRRGDYEDHDCDFAQKDGFDDFMAMAEWFDKTYGLPFDGFVIYWRPHL